MALRRMFDAAFPPESPPKVDAVAGYIGGGTPHVWTDQEWADELRKSGATYRLPIFVRVPPTTRDPRVEARFCLDWAARHGQPKGTLIALDYETAINATYLNAFDDVIVAGGYRCIVYGTRRTILQNPEPSGGYWTATWNNIPHLDAGATITQYGGDSTLGQPWDLNVVADHAPLWNTEDDMTVDEFVAQLTTPNSKTRNALRDLAALGSQDTLRTAVAGDKNTPAGPYFAGLANSIADVQTALTAGFKVSLDVTQLTPDQLAMVAEVFAGKVVITGVQAKAGQFTVTFEPAA